MLKTYLRSELCRSEMPDMLRNMMCTFRDLEKVCYFGRRAEDMVKVYINAFLNRDIKCAWRRKKFDL